MKFPIKNILKKNSENLRAFTLIEMIVSVTIFSIIIIMAFSAMGNIGILRNSVTNRLDLNNELYSVTEKFVDLIKTGGDIDYEEYWNRRAVGTTTSSGHYDVFSGFGNYGSGGVVANYGDGIYYCISGNGLKMGTGGCLTGFNIYTADVSSQPQRYGEYRQQFIDYNTNANGDGGDENADGNIRGDDDDEDLGMGPSAFTGGIGMKELYLVKKGTQSERIYFRWTLQMDPNGPPGTICEMSGANMGSGNCLGNIQMLKLVGKDLGLSHSTSVASPGKYDGIIDTWACHADYNCTGVNNLPAGVDSEWVNIFPTWINVKNVDFFLYPEKDFRYAWKESDPATLLNSYVRIHMTIGLAWEKRKKIRGPAADMTIATTVNLSK
ncbi:MAG: prepilin-type N-terminal cleavage/methylation domain-containing protein [Candidatus Gracilibacteria bacterium]